MSVDHAQLDRDHLWHPFTQQQGWCEEEPLMIERAEGCAPDRHRRPPLPRRRLLALVQRPRPSPPRDRRGHPRRSSTASPTRRCSASPTPAPPSSPRAWSSSRRPASHASSTRTRLDRDRDRAEDGLPVPAAARRPARPRAPPSSHLRDAYHGDTIGSVSVGGIDLFHAAYRPLLFDGRTPPSRATAGRLSSAILAAHEEEDRRGDRRAAGAGRGGDDRPAAGLPARRPRALRRATACC